MSDIEVKINMCGKDCQISEYTTSIVESESFNRKLCTVVNGLKA